MSHAPQPGPGPFEVELKVPARHDPVRQRLVELGAREGKRLEQVDTYYQAPHRDLSEADEAVRIRTQLPLGEEPGNTAGRASEGPSLTAHRLTYKGPRVDPASKTRAEHEVGIEDPEAMDAFLRALGFRAVARVRKERRIYSLRGFEVALDHVEGLGTFVEVEVAAGEHEREDAARAAAELLGELGLDAGNQVRQSYLELLHPPLEGR